MKRLQLLRACTVLVLAVVVGLARPAIAQEPSLTPDEVEEFLLTAEVSHSERTEKGITRPWRLTMTDGVIEHDAQFQSVDVRRAQRNIRGRNVLQWADSYKYNIAGYRLARLIGLGHMVPVTVEREWESKKGALSWWIPAVLMDEKKRKEDGVDPPNLGQWRARYRTMLVFGQLIRDEDRNQGNILYDAQWRLWMVDFSRAFRISEDIANPLVLQRLGRGLFMRLQRVTDEEIRDQLGPYLTELEMNGLLARREKMVDHIERRIVEHGEDRVLY